MGHMLQQVQEKIWSQPSTNIETLNVLVKGIQIYMGGDDIEEEDERDEDDDQVETALTLDDFDAM